MNYRHSFHAGNPCDVVKHVLWIYALVELQKTCSKLDILETHAGTGLTSLQSPDCLKTREFEQGVLQILKHQDHLKHPTWKLYLSIIKKYPNAYPGSPLFTEALLRPSDTLTCVELHPEDVKLLKKHVKSNVIHANGYDVIKNQSLVFIDPPFEDRNEFSTLIKALKKIKESAVVWYPIKNRADVDTFYEEVTSLAIPHHYVEFHFFKAQKDGRLNGTGMLFLNTPPLPKVYSILKEALPILSFDGEGAIFEKRV